MKGVSVPDVDMDRAALPEMDIEDDDRLFLWDLPLVKYMWVLSEQRGRTRMNTSTG